MDGATSPWTAPGADNGKVTFTYTNGTHVLKLGSPGNLHTYNVSGCAGLITNGSPASLSARYTITPPQAITSTMAIGPRFS